MEPENLNQETPQVEQTSSLRQVTPLSKYLTLVLFIILPFVGGYIGYTFAPEKVVEVEKVVTKEVVVEKKVETTEATNARQFTDNEGVSRLVFTHPTEGYRFSYPEDWRLYNNGYIQLFNFPEPVTDQKGWGDRENKIEGGSSVSSKKDLPDWDEYSATMYGNKTVYIKKGGIDGGWHWTSFALQLPSDSSKVLLFTIYGDTDNFDPMLQIFLRDFIFLSSEA